MINIEKYLEYSRIGDIFSIKKMIFDGDVNINSSLESSEKLNSIFYACDNGHVELVKYLYNIGVVLHKPTTYTIRLANRGHFGVIDFLIKSKIFDMKTTPKYVCSNLIFSRSFHKLYNYSKYFNFEPFEFLSMTYIRDLDNVLIEDEFKETVKNKMSNIKSIKRDYEIFKIIEIS